MTTWNTFGPDIAFAALPAAFQRCLPPYPGGVRPPGCDDVVGSAASGLGFCAQAPYKTMTYCSCANASLGYGGCPMIASPYCANSAHSFMPSRWFAPAGPGADTPYNNCAKSPICINMVEVGGDQNVVTGVTQQCGTITNVTNVIKTNPTMAVLLFILLIAFIVVAALPVEAEPLGESPSSSPSGNTFWT